MNAEICTMTPEEFEAYGLDRVHSMQYALEHAIEWRRQRDTPLNRLVVNMAEHQLAAAEKRFGISRYDQRLSSCKR